jgi:hypothetical protein
MVAKKAEPFSDNYSTDSKAFRSKIDSEVPTDLIMTSSNPVIEVEVEGFGHA